jgi:hypothetical protein
MSDASQPKTLAEAVALAALTAPDSRVRALFARLLDGDRPKNAKPKRRRAAARADPK